MMELKVILDFACCSCDQTIHVTVKCAGKGLAAGARTVAAVQVPCPNCGNLNRVYFEPSGTVREVTTCKPSQLRLEPSVN